MHRLLTLLLAVSAFPIFAQTEMPSMGEFIDKRSRERIIIRCSELVEESCKKVIFFERKKGDSPERALHADPLPLSWIHESLVTRMSQRAHLEKEIDHFGNTQSAYEELGGVVGTILLPATIVLDLGMYPAHVIKNFSLKHRTKQAIKSAETILGLVQSPDAEVREVKPRIISLLREIIQTYQGSLKLRLTCKGEFNGKSLRFELWDSAPQRYVILPPGYVGYYQARFSIGTTSYTRYPFFLNPKTRELDYFDFKGVKEATLAVVPELAGAITIHNPFEQNNDGSIPQTEVVCEGIDLN